MASETIYKLENRGDVVIVTTNIKVITYNDNMELKKAFTNLLEVGSKNIVLDLTVTYYVSTMVLASLVFMQKTLKESKGNFVICGISEHIKEILEMTNLDKVLDIATDSEEAVNRILNKKQAN